jgi:PAT family beta-lactamase induction signal transducer AmpG
MTYRWRFALLYFSEGAPIGFLWWAMPTLLRNEGVAVERIAGLTAALAVPWALKFLWAPLVDVMRGPRWGFRHWAMTAQVGMGLTLLPLGFVDPLEGFSLWVGLLLAHAVCAATQDVAIDALAVTTVPAAERGRVNGAMQMGMLVGRGAFAGGAIWLMVRGGWALPVLALTTAVWVSLVVLWIHPEKPVTEKSSQPWRQFRITLGKVLVGANTWIGIAFALVAGFEATGALAGPWLTDLGVPMRRRGGSLHCRSW